MWNVSLPTLAPFPPISLTLKYDSECYITPVVILPTHVDSHGFSWTLDHNVNETEQDRGHSAVYLRQEAVILGILKHENRYELDTGSPFIWPDQYDRC